MITKDQFQSLKEYVLSRLSSEKEFYLTEQEILKLLETTKPYYLELKKLNEEDGLSFLTEGKYVDLPGDPSDKIRFYHKPE